MSRTVKFDHEKLDVYQLSLEFITWVTDLLPEVKDSGLPNLRETIDQLDRASTSIVLNIAEGNGRRATQQRAKFFDDARGSGAECAGCLDILVAKRASSNERMEDGKDMLVRIISMLTRLVERFDQNG